MSGTAKSSMAMSRYSSYVKNCKPTRPFVYETMKRKSSELQSQTNLNVSAELAKYGRPDFTRRFVSPRPNLPPK
jgi:hypothetical protein